ncbi:MAG: hypothetical protein ACTS6G_03850 [Candidatus Hodgkinia cicadicola]
MLTYINDAKALISFASEAFSERINIKLTLPLTNKRLERNLSAPELS